ncbi:unnamed protein product [Amoebophrya sp. A120]|nr:unnamed protein product [Amoebophrya sp. A120]|eukprot:GSA120T00011355001.1
MGDPAALSPDALKRLGEELIRAAGAASSGREQDGELLNILGLNREKVQEASEYVKRKRAAKSVDINSTHGSKSAGEPESKRVHVGGGSGQASEQFIQRQEVFTASAHVVISSASSSSSSSSSKLPAPAPPVLFVPHPQADAGDRYPASASSAQAREFPIGGSVDSGKNSKISLDAGLAGDAVSANVAHQQSLLQPGWLLNRNAVDDDDDGASSDNEEPEDLEAIDGVLRPFSPSGINALAPEIFDAPEEDGDDRDSWDGEGGAADRDQNLPDSPNEVVDSVGEQELLNFFRGSADTHYWEKKRNKDTVKTVLQGKENANEVIQDLLRYQGAFEVGGGANAALEPHQRVAAKIFEKVDMDQLLAANGGAQHSLQGGVPPAPNVVPGGRQGKKTVGKRVLLYHRTGSGKSKSMLQLVNENFHAEKSTCAKILILKNRTQKVNLLREFLKWPSKLRDFAMCEIQRTEKQTLKKIVGENVDWKEKRGETWDTAMTVDKETLATFEKIIELRGHVIQGKIKPAQKEVFEKNMRKILFSHLDRNNRDVERFLPGAPIRLFTYSELARSLKTEADASVDAALKFPVTSPNPLSQKTIIVDEAHNLCINSEVLAKNPRSANAVKKVVAALTTASAATSILFLTATPVVKNLAGQYDSKFLLNVLKGDAFKAEGNEGFVSFYNGRKGFPQVKTDLEEDYTLFGKPGCQSHVVESTLQGRALAKYGQMCRKLQREHGKKQLDTERLLRWCAADKQLTKLTRRDELERCNQANLLADRFPKLLTVCNMVTGQVKKGKAAILVSLRGGLENLVQLLRLKLPYEHRVLVMRDAQDKDEALSKFNKYVHNDAGGDDDLSYPVLVANNKYCGESVTMLEVNHLHLLDVPPTWLEYQQLVGRSCRFKSHAHLPAEKQYCHYFLHTAVLPFGNSSEWKRVLYSTVLTLKEPGFHCHTTSKIEEARGKYLQIAQEWEKILQDEENITSRAQLAKKSLAEKRRILQAADTLFDSEDLARFETHMVPDTRAIEITLSKEDPSLLKLLQKSAKKKAFASQIFKELKSVKVERDAGRARAVSGDGIRVNQNAADASGGAVKEPIDEMTTQLRRGLAKTGRAPFRLVRHTHKITASGQEHTLKFQKKTIPFPAKGNDLLQNLSADKRRLKNLGENMGEVETKMEQLRWLAVDRGQYADL